MKAWLKKLIAWLNHLADEGKQTMDGISGEASAIVTDAAQTVEHVVSNAVSGAEAAMQATAVVVEADASKILAEATPLAAAVVSSVDTVLGRIKDLLDSSQQPVGYWSEITTLAKALNSDADAVIAKVKQLIEYSGMPAKAWDEIVALAKKLAAA